MNIRWLGHSAFLITTGAGVSVLTDPYDPYVGCRMPSAAPDIVTVSHDHEDHNCLEAVSGSPCVLRGGDVYDKGGLSVSSVHTFHDSEKGRLRGDNFAFVFKADGLTLCHMGDVGEFVPELFRPIDIDVLMLPVGGKYTVDGNTAYRYVEQLKPSLVLPMHFKTPYCNFAIDGADVFLARFNKENVFYADILQPELYLKKGCTRVAVMNFKA